MAGQRSVFLPTDGLVPVGVQAVEYILDVFALGVGGARQPGQHIQQFFELKFGKPPVVIYIEAAEQPKEVFVDGNLFALGDDLGLAG